MFRGKFETTIDAKGRTSIPAKFREVLVDTFGDERFFLTKSSPVPLGDGAFGYGLVIYPYKKFLELEAQLQSGEGLNLTMAQLAVAWVLHNPNVACAIIGASKPRQIKENVAASGVVLSPEVMSRIDDALGDVVVRNPMLTVENSPKGRP